MIKILTKKALEGFAEAFGIITAIYLIIWFYDPSTKAFCKDVKTNEPYFLESKTYKNHCKGN